MTSRYHSAVPEPTEDPKSIHETVMALKQNVEVLTQQRKPKSASAVTWQDLLDLELITPDQIPT